VVCNAIAGKTTIDVAAPSISKSMALLLPGMVDSHTSGLYNFISILKKLSGALEKRALN